MDSAKKYLGVAFDKPSSLLDYLDDKTFIVVDERHQGISHGKAWYNIVNENYTEVITAIKGSEAIKTIFKPNLHKDINDIYDCLLNL